MPQTTVRACVVGPNHSFNLGISHNEIEDAKEEHIVAGTNVLLHAMLDRAGVA